MKDMSKQQKQEITHLFLCEEYELMTIRFSQFMVDQVEVQVENLPVKHPCFTEVLFCEDAFHFVFYRNLIQINLRDDLYLNKDQRESLSAFLEKHVKEIKSFWNGYKFAIQSNAHM